MKNSLPIVFIAFLAVTFWSCEQPESPDFQVNNQFEVPLTMEKTYPFLGTDDALLDTTSEDFEDLFTTDGDGLVRLVKEEEVNFGDLNDAIPEVNVPETDVSSSVDEISIGSFTSGGGNIGTASFNDLVGQDPTFFSQGDDVPDQDPSPTANIKLTTDNFDSAVLSSDGSIEITLTNNLGFDVDEFFIELNSSASASPLGETSIQNFEDNTEKSGTINLDEGDELRELEVDVYGVWTNKIFKRDPGPLSPDNIIVEDVQGQNLNASEVTAAVPEQEFNTSESIQVDDDSFLFESEEHYIHIDSGTLRIENLTNDIPLQEDVEITFLDIREEDNTGEYNDPLTVSFTIDAAESGVPGELDSPIEENLENYRIFANGNTLEYEISGKTKDTGNDNRTISTDQQFSADVNISNLEILKADGTVRYKQILLNEDNTNDFEENIDVFNDDEAEITEIGGINEISDRISNITFENPVLNMLYETNLGVETTIYAIIAGTDEQGNTEFLTGLDGTNYQVQDNEIPSQLEADGQLADASQVIKFDLETAEEPDADEGESGNNLFDASNTNASEFFSNLPSNIRFVGVAEVNEKKEPGIIVDPVIFEPSFGVEIPFSLSADNATYQDTVDADFSDLPEEDEDTKLSETTITINYTNGLPLDLTLNVIMLDENGDEVTTKSDISINGASTDENGFVSEESQSEHEMSFSESEMNDLHRTRSMVMDININTPEQQGVSIRGDDAVTFNVKVKAGITSTIN